MFTHFYNIPYIIKTNNQFKENGETLIYRIKVEKKIIYLLGSIGVDELSCYPVGCDLLVLPYQGKRKLVLPALEVINRLKEIGYSGCVSSRSQNKMADNNKIDIVDVNGELPINIQNKYTANTPNYFGIRDACSDKSKPFVLFWKKATNDGTNSPGTIVMVPDWYFYELIKK
jgi:hypothetical protein